MRRTGGVGPRYCLSLSGYLHKYPDRLCTVKRHPVAPSTGNQTRTEVESDYETNQAHRPDRPCVLVRSIGDVITRGYMQNINSPLGMLPGYPLEGHPHLKPSVSCMQSQRVSSSYRRYSQPSCALMDSRVGVCFSGGGVQRRSKPQVRRSLQEWLLATCLLIR